MGNRKELDMILFENNTGYKKVCIWKDEMPFNYAGQDKLCSYVGASDISWHIGTICIEAKLHSRHISTYAMICMRYTDNLKNKANIIINYGRKKSFFKSQVLPFNKMVYVGLDKEFVDAIEEFFQDYTLEQLPSGTIEILTGGYDEVGSSNVTFKKVMELLVFIFQHIDELSDDALKHELLNII